ncbi:hypothetical protein [Roseimarinus sediminis]|uniref:hypothetical protein n=1 Tax=Roseimarinus sediminis TaxID=1610899 RepID=UPI003D1C6361
MYSAKQAASQSERLKANSPRLPFEISAALAADYGQLYPTRWGAMLSISKRWGNE